MLLGASPYISAADQIGESASLVRQLSSQFTRAGVDELATTIRTALAQIGPAFGTTVCCLIEFDQREEFRTHYVWALAGNRLVLEPRGTQWMPWLVQQLGRGDVISVRSDDEHPIAAAQDRIHLRQLGIRSAVGIPASVDGRLVCGLWLGTPAEQGWDDRLVDRIRQIVEIIAVALRRAGDQARLQTHQAELDLLTASVNSDVVYLREEIRTCMDFNEIVGDSAQLKVALERLCEVAPLNSSVLLLGETGTGKELFARALHDRSPRRNRPFIRVNCATLPSTLIESELFGHEKGAFTGAVASRQGRFELADGGTLFLDEIGDLPPELQVKLLGVLQEHQFERLGSSRTRHVDVRVVAATHRDLAAAMAAGQFRADLYYRLGVYPIQLPALRERRTDIPALVWFFIHHRQRALGRRITQIPRPVMEAIQAYDWPGNIRELQNVIERAMIRSRGNTLHLDEGSAEIRVVTRSPMTGTLAGVQRAHIVAVLQECSWRINGTGNAADRLGLHPNTLRFRMQKLGVSRPQC